MFEVNSSEITVKPLNPKQEKSYLSSTQKLDQDNQTQHGKTVLAMEGFTPQTTREDIMEKLKKYPLTFSLDYSRGKVKGFLVIKPPSTAEQVSFDPLD